MPLDEKRLPPVEPSSVHARGATQRLIIEALARTGELGVADLASALAVSSSAVRQHMTRLVADETVTFREVSQGGRGRPRRLYALTRAGKALLPTVSDGLALTLFYQIMEARPEVVLPVLRDQFLARTSDTLAILWDRPTNDDAVTAFEKVLDRADYLPTVENGETEDEYTLTLGHCPLLALAHAFRRGVQHRGRELPDVSPWRPYRARPPQAGR